MDTAKFADILDSEKITIYSKIDAFLCQYECITSSQPDAFDIIESRPIKTYSYINNYITSGYTSHKINLLDILDLEITPIQNANRIHYNTYNTCQIPLRNYSEVLNIITSILSSNNQQDLIFLQKCLSIHRPLDYKNILRHWLETNTHLLHDENSMLNLKLKSILIPEELNIYNEYIKSYHLRDFIPDYKGLKYIKQQLHTYTPIDTLKAFISNKLYTLNQIHINKISEDIYLHYLRHEFSNMKDTYLYISHLPNAYMKQTKLELTTHHILHSPIIPNINAIQADNSYELFLQQATFYKIPTIIAISNYLKPELIYITPVKNPLYFCFSVDSIEPDIINRTKLIQIKTNLIECIKTSLNFFIEIKLVYKGTQSKYREIIDTLRDRNFHSALYDFMDLNRQNTDIYIDSLTSLYNRVVNAPDMDCIAKIGSESKSYYLTPYNDMQINIYTNSILYPYNLTVFDALNIPYCDILTKDIQLKVHSPCNHLKFEIMHMDLDLNCLKMLFITELLALEIDTTSLIYQLYINMNFDSPQRIARMNEILNHVKANLDTLIEGQFYYKMLLTTPIGKSIQSFEKFITNTCIFINSESEDLLLNAITRFYTITINLHKFTHKENPYFDKLINKALNNTIKILKKLDITGFYYYSEVLINPKCELHTKFDCIHQWIATWISNKDLIQGIISKNPKLDLNNITLAQHYIYMGFKKMYSKLLTN